MSFDELKGSYHTTIGHVKDHLYTLKTTPDFALTNRAFLVQSAGGNILWDCVPLIDNGTIEPINSIGGLQAIAFSNPHYYSTMNKWTRLFNCPVYIHENDEQ